MLSYSISSDYLTYFDFYFKFGISQVEPIIPSLHGFHSDPIGFAGEEYLPLPASKGLAFPFLLTSMGSPLHTYNLRSGTMGPTKNGEIPVNFFLTTGFRLR